MPKNSVPLRAFVSSCETKMEEAKPTPEQLPGPNCVPGDKRRRGWLCDVGERHEPRCMDRGSARGSAGRRSRTAALHSLEVEMPGCDKARADGLGHGGLQHDRDEAYAGAAIAAQAVYAKGAPKQVGPAARR